MLSGGNRRWLRDESEAMYVDVEGDDDGINQEMKGLTENVAVLKTSNLGQLGVKVYEGRKRGWASPVSEAQALALRVAKPNEDFNLEMPQCCIGDFNDKLYLDDKKGGVPQPEWLLRGFQEAVTDYDLCDLPLHGYPFTWAHSKGSLQEVKERLDHSLVSSAWLEPFSNFRLTNLSTPFSEHSPLLLDTDVSFVTQGPRSFRFENAWLREEGLGEVVRNSWENSSGLVILDRLNQCSVDLLAWGEKLSLKFRDEIKWLGVRLSV
ncbi:hypothetical protein PTKIN_Ptkin08bG0177100 [Pterospermum kingtungense]